MLGRQGKPNTREPRTREGDPKAVYESAAKKIQTAIAAGEITQAQGKARLEGLKKGLAQKAKGEKSQGKRQRDGATKKDMDWKGVKGK